MNNQTNYYRSLKRVYTTLAIFCSLLPMLATAQINISVAVMPQYPGKLTDFLSRPQQTQILVTLPFNNLSRGTQTIHLRATLTNNNGITISVNPAYQSAPFAIGYGQTIRLGVADIANLFDVNKDVFTGTTRQQLISQNGLPEGNYQLCVQAFNAANTLIGSGCSNNIPVSNVETPVIILPADKQVVPTLAGQNFIISWTRPAGAPPTTQYVVKMVEMFDNRNPTLALQSSGAPIFFQRTVTGINSLLYSPDMPTLTPGRQYALLITAQDVFNTVTFRNGGRSAVTSFIYGADKNTVPGSAGDLVVADKIPGIIIKGNVNWYFRKSEENAPSPASPLKRAVDPTPTLYTSTSMQALLLDPNAPVSVIANGNKKLITHVLTATVPTAAVVPAASQLLNTNKAIYALAGGGTGQALATPTTDFDKPGTVAHPLTNVPVKLMAVTHTAPGATASYMIGSATTDPQGNFLIRILNPLFSGKAVANYALDIGDVHFVLAGKAVVPITDTTTMVNMGEVKLLANTYKFMPTVTGAGNTVAAGATVSVYRRKDIYDAEPFLRNEGTISQGLRFNKIIDGITYVLIDSLVSGQTTTRYFFSGSSADQYKIIARAANYTTNNTSLALTTASTNTALPFTLNQTYKLGDQPATFTGHVYSELKGVQTAMKGAVVTLYLDKAVVKGTSWSRVSANTSEPALVLNQKINSSAGTQAGNKSGISNALLPAQTAKAVTPPLVVDKTPAVGGDGVKSALTPDKLVLAIGYWALLEQYTAVTDDNGDFVFNDVPIGNQYIHYRVKAPTSNASVTDSVMIDKPGEYQHRDIPFRLKGYAVTGRVIDDLAGIPNPMVKWASGGTWVPSTPTGYFSTYHIAGTDTLIIEKIGYNTKRVPVTITAPNVAPPADNTAGYSSFDKYSASLQNTPMIRLPGPAGPVTASSFGLTNTPAPVISPPVSNIAPGSVNVFSNLAQNSVVIPAHYPQLAALAAAVLPTPNADVSGAVNVGDIVLNKRIRRLLITVTDINKKAISGATVSIDGDNTATAQLTDSKGQVSLKGPAGMLLDIKGPSSGAYVPIQLPDSVDANLNQVVAINVTLLQGIVITGTILAANNSPIGSATIAYVGRDYITTTTDAATGKYSLVIPAGNGTLKASRSGFISQQKNFTTNKQIDFQLAKPQFIATNLLGFTVEIDSDLPGKGGNRLISGSFTNLQGNSVFTINAGTKIKFKDVEVSIQNNIPVPVAGKVITDEVSLKVKAFNYLPLTLTNKGSNIIITERDNSALKGQLMGYLSIDYDSFVPVGFPSYIKAKLEQYVVTAAQTTPAPISVLTEPGGSYPVYKSLFMTGTGNQDFNLNGFNVTLTLPKSTVQGDGLHLQGSVSFTGVPLIGGTVFSIQDLWIGKDGGIKSLTADISPPHNTFNIAGWGATLSSLSYNDNGFQFSGNVSVQLPSSAAGSIDFSNLQIAPDGLYGGNFNINGDLDIFRIVSFRNNGSPLSFGKIGNSSVYYIGGGGSLHFPDAKLAGDLNIDFFQIQTDGKFSATVPVDLHTNLYGLADITIKTLSFQNTKQLSVNIGGDFSLNAIPDFKATVGGLHFTPGGNLSVDKLGIGFDMPGIGNVGVTIGFFENAKQKGFTGQGRFGILGLGGADVGFNYIKENGSVSVGAKFSANTAIPIGNSGATIIQLGGGFDYSKSAWDVNINGTIALGYGPFANAKVWLTVSNGPVISGNTELDILNITTVGKGNITIDIPQQLLSIDYSTGMTLIPFYTQVTGANIVVGLKSSDRYFLIGSYQKLNILNVFTQNATFTLGYNVDFTKHPSLAALYQSTIYPDLYTGGHFTGISAYTGISFDLNLALPDVSLSVFNVGMSGHISYNQNGYLGAALNMSKTNTGINLLAKYGAKWDVGASAHASIAHIGEIGASFDVGFGAELSGNLYLSPTAPSTSYFNVNATAAAKFQAKAHWGDSDRCIFPDCVNDACIKFEYLLPVAAGFSLCFDRSLTVGFDTRKSFPIYYHL